MTSTALPTCCTPFSDRWPLPHPEPRLQLISTHFDKARLQPEDFERSAVPMIKAVAKRQAEFLAGRVCACEALRRLTGTGSVPASGEDRAPQWPENTLGSITHSDSYAAAVVGSRTDWQGLGIDAETLIEPQRAQRLSGEILTGSELERIQHLPAAEQARLITLTFSAKESLFKALYPQVLKRFWFHDAELLSVDNAQQFTMRLLIDLDANWVTGSVVTGQFCQMDNYLLTLIAIPR
ncbi:4'-phosphopantetheinyl transferase superfamily protein [Ectopseudomonas mendocina]|uniref:Enterobactin synthase component D n=1 Tax=Ectopseudomonas mendocina TaxID=300 RepID=A0ABZ2RM06_ECTME